MLAVRRLRPDDWALYRDLRLRALADAPDAFCSTLARERAFPDSLWRDRLVQAGPASSCPLVATLDGAPCALVWAMTSRERPDVAEIFQMWVAPEARGHGVGRRLLDAAAGWAGASGHAVLALECMRDNEAAMRLYADCGFAVTGDAGSHDDRDRDGDSDGDGDGDRDCDGEAPDTGTLTSRTPVRLERALVPTTTSEDASAARARRRSYAAARRSIYGRGRGG